MNNFQQKHAHTVSVLSTFKALINKWNPPFKLLACWGMSLLLLITGCSQVESWQPWTQATQFVTINDVHPTQTPGRYQISGLANLTDGTSIAVSAVRPLLLGKVSPSSEDSDQTRYAILDRQLVPVTAGTWQVELTLRGAQSGNYETWQTAYPDMQNSLTPTATVNFIATLDPGLQTEDMAQRLLKDTVGFNQGSIRLNDDGELFAIATTTLDIAPPAGGIVGKPETPAPSLPLEKALPADSSPSLSSNREPASTLPLAPDAYFQ